MLVKSQGPPPPSPQKIVAPGSVTMFSGLWVLQQNNLQTPCSKMMGLRARTQGSVEKRVIKVNDLEEIIYLSVPRSLLWDIVERNVWTRRFVQIASSHGCVFLDSSTVKYYTCIYLYELFKADHQVYTGHTTNTRTRKVGDGV